MNRVLGRQQSGAALIIGLIMLLLLTLMVGSAFTLSGTNLKSVGNMQSRDQAIAAANAAIEQKISSNLTVSLTTEPINVDIDSDGAVDYEVTVEPTCLSSTVATYAGSTGLSGEETKDYSGAGAPETIVGYNVVLDIKSDVLDPASGASVTVKAGVRVLLTEAQMNAVCI